MVSDDGCKNDILYDLEHNKMIFPEKKNYRKHIGIIWGAFGMSVVQ